MENGKQNREKKAVVSAFFQEVEILQKSEWLGCATPDQTLPPMTDVLRIGG